MINIYVVASTAFLREHFENITRSCGGISFKFYVRIVCIFPTNILAMRCSLQQPSLTLHGRSGWRFPVF